MIVRSLDFIPRSPARFAAWLAALALLAAVRPLLSAADPTATAAPASGSAPAPAIPPPPATRPPRTPAAPTPAPAVAPEPEETSQEAGATEGDAAEELAEEPELEEQKPSRPDATSPGNPYRPIVARNAFRLREPAPPPPPPTNAPPPPEPVKIDVKLAGLAKIKGVRYAYLMVPDADRPGQFLYPSLTDDPTQGRIRHGSGLEVREIDIKKQTVRVVNGGIEATLNFKDNGLKKENVPAAGGPPRPGGIPAPGAPGAAPVLNRANVKTTVFPAGGGGLPQPPSPAPPSNEPLVFSRNPNRASTGSGNNFNQGLNNTVGGVGVGNASGGTVAPSPVLPGRTVRTDSPLANIPSIPLEQQYDLLIRQRQAAESVGIRLPPIPGMPDPGPTP